MSRNFSMNRGSLESLKPSTRCGCNPNARQMRLTMVWLSPQRLAIARVLQCVASAGVLSRVTRTTRSTWASVTSGNGRWRAAGVAPALDAMYAAGGRPSIAPEKLLRALLLQLLYTVRSERQLMEQLDYNLLFRWF